MKNNDIQKMYKNKFEAKKIQILEEGEEARQCVNHQPYWFVTNKGRVLSVYGKEIKEVQYLKEMGYKNKNGEYSQKKYCVGTRIDGKYKNFFVHALVAEYFSDQVCSYDIRDNEKKEIHHIKLLNKNNTQVADNCVDNLQVLPREIHKALTSVAGITWEDIENKTDYKRMKSMREHLEDIPGMTHVIVTNPDGNDAYYCTASVESVFLKLMETLKKKSKKNEVMVNEQ